MKKLLFIFLFCVSAGLIVSCVQNDSGNSDKKITELESQINLLQNQVNQLTSQVSALQNAEVIFTPSSKGYAVLHSNVGYFVVSLDNLTKYANGYKATFSIGNPSLMTFSNPKAVIKWGEAYASGENFANWYNTLKSQEININEPILPGMWNKITVVLSPAEAKETGVITLGIIADQVNLTPDFRRTRN